LAHRGNELAAKQRMADFPWHMWTAYEGVGVVDVNDAPPEPRPLDYRPG
jgi:hypothetical protein